MANGFGCVFISASPMASFIFPLPSRPLAQLPATDENREMDLNAALAKKEIKEIFVEFFAVCKGHMF